MFLRANAGTLSRPHWTLPHTVSRLVLLMAAASALASLGSSVRLIASAATSKSAWMKPMGMVHCRLAATSKPLASCAALSPVRDDLKGCCGVHQVSLVMLWPSGPSAATVSG